MKRGFGYGKGAHEQPFVGRDEYADAVFTGFEIGHVFDDEIEDTDTASKSDVDSEKPNSLDQFRSKTLRRSSKSSRGEENS